MRFAINNMLRTQPQVRDCVLIKKTFMTYATSNSFRVNSNFICRFKYVADGWPVAVYGSLFAKQKIKRLSFFKLRDFWIEIAETNRIAIIGYEKRHADELSEQLILANIRPVLVEHGFHSDVDIYHIIEGLAGKVDIVFLAVGQPRQEHILDNLAHLEGSMSIVCCGAFWIQEVLGLQGVSKVTSGLLLVPIMRFWNAPTELFKRTFVSLIFLLKNLY